METQMTSKRWIGLGWGRNNDIAIVADDEGIKGEWRES
jgi:hypothetical protein